jgi:uncharacterized protein (TIGR02722 family)
MKASILINGMLLLCLSFVVGCGPKVFTKGEYDDPNRVELLDDRWNEADMQQMADSIVKAMISCDNVAKASAKPVVIVDRVKNKTMEHIDMQALTNKIRTALIKSKKVRFINKERRGAISEEYDYQQSGMVDKVRAKGPGSQSSADYLMSGTLHTNVQEVGDDKFIYYKLNMNLTNLKTSEMDCVEEREIRKQFEKQHI